MSRQATAALIPTASIAASATGPSDYVFTAITVAQVSPVLIGKNRIFVINYQPTAASTTGLNITFGSSLSGSSGTLTPTATNSYQIPPNQQTTFDMGPNLDSINFIAPAAGVVFIKLLGVN